MIMKKSLPFVLVLIFICASCAKDQLFDPPDVLPGNSSPYNLISPQIRIAVVSDIHYTHPELLPENIEDSPSLMQYLGLDRKILELSDPIFREVHSELVNEKPDILLIPGDLTKDGERMGHEVMQGFLQELESTGIKVYVVPGNNDVLNSDALSFTSEPPVPVDNITPDEFAEIYGDFGYNEAIYRDVNSLSYICQPHDNLWILGIDNCKYAIDEKGKTKVTGAISPGTLAWIEEKMAEARENNIEVLTFMHFGIIEHYAGQKGVEPLISGSGAKAISLMNAGIRLIFTGHYHANDIVEFANDGKTLFDIQTGSLVTPPFSYRIMTLNDNFINIDTRRVTHIDAELPEGADFMTYSEANLTSRLDSFFTYYLVVMFGLEESTAAFFAPYISTAYSAYFAGDEKMSPEENMKLDALPESLAPLVNIVRSFWTDLPPNDNKIHIKLK
jgi:predicted MPP superfamily phosphohydrolase